MTNATTAMLACHYEDLKTHTPMELLPLYNFFLPSSKASALLIQIDQAKNMAII